MVVALVSCVSLKLSEAVPAMDLYCSSWFKKAKKYVMRNYKKWFILSAEYGLVDPSVIISPYEKTLNKMKKIDRIKWAERVFNQIQKEDRIRKRIDVFAGSRYREFLLPLLETDGYEIGIPLKGLKIGEQLQWFQRKIREEELVFSKEIFL